MSQYLSSLIGIIPVGSVLAHTSDVVPEGWLECDGSSLSSTTYSDLHGVLGTKYGGGVGTFNLPDYRGYFLRGWDHGAGNDPDAASRTDRGDTTTGDYVGTKQGDEFKSHNHGMELILAYASGTANGAVHKFGSNRTTSNSGGNESRPKNINVMYIIKY